MELNGSIFLIPSLRMFWVETYENCQYSTPFDEQKQQCWAVQYNNRCSETGVCHGQFRLPCCSEAIFSQTSLSLLLSTGQCPHHSANPLCPKPDMHPRPLHLTFFWMCFPLTYPAPWRPLPDLSCYLLLGWLPEPLAPLACAHMALSTRIQLSCCYQNYSLILQMQSQFCVE